MYVVDSDISARQALARLISSVHLQVKLFDTGRGFLQSQRPDVPSCLVLDVRLNDLNGFDLQNQLADTGNHIPVIFIAAYGDVSTSVRAMKAGAVDFLTKPYRDQDVLDAINLALERDRARRSHEFEIGELRRRFRSLTRRERDVITMVASGVLNKNIGHCLGVC